MTVAKVLRLAGDSAAPTAAAPDADEATAVLLKPGMLVTHPEFTRGRRVRVDRVSNRGTHVEVIGHHPANGRGFMLKPSPQTKFTVHERPSR